MHPCCCLQLSPPTAPRVRAIDIVLYMQLSLGSKAFECARYGTESPATFYDAPSSLNAMGAAIARAPRFRDAAAHDATPAADYDHSRFISAGKAVASGTTMPKALRAPPPSTSLESPGAPAYLIKRDAAHYRYPAAGGRSLGARTDWAGCAAGCDVPGPGAYDVAKGISNPDLRAHPAFAASDHALGVEPSQHHLNCARPGGLYVAYVTSSRGSAAVCALQASSGSLRRPWAASVARRGALLRSFLRPPTMCRAQASTPPAARAPRRRAAPRSRLAARRASLRRR